MNATKLKLDGYGDLECLEYLKGKLYMHRNEAYRLLGKYLEDLPTNTFLHAVASKHNRDKADPIPIEKLMWGGNQTNTTKAYLTGLLHEILAHTTGDADILVHWGNGKMTGLRVYRGAVTEHLVSYALKEEAC